MLLVLAGGLPAAQGALATANPLGKVLELIDDLSAKVTADGEAADKAYHEYFEWCDDASKNSQFAIKTSTDEKAKLEAKIGEKTSDIQVSETEIAKLAASISESSEDLKKATGIREKEAADFAASEKEMMEAVDALSRAIKIIKEQTSKGASFAQIDTSNMRTALVGLGAVLDAASFSTSDRQKLVALAQTSEDSDDEELGAPAAAAYKSQSGGIVDVLEDMEAKAEEELGSLRKGETAARNGFEMLKQGLEDKIANENKDLADEKSAKAAAEEAKATATGDLEATTKALAQGVKELETVQTTCLVTAKDHEASVAARAEELKVIGEAKKIIQESTGGAAEQSFLQLSSSASAKARATGQKVVSLVKRLAQKHHSSALAQLASRIAAEMRYGSGEDPFAKIRGLISDMITKLEKEADEEATEKAYCDEEMGKTETKKGELEDEVAKTTATIDQAVSKSADLKEQVKELELELGQITKEQAEMDKIRQEAHADYVKAKADLELGLNGVRKALQLLRDYYQSKDEEASFVQTDDSNFMQQPAAPVMHSKSGGAGSGIIGILEICESDFATGLAKEEAEESDAQAEYDKVSQENKVNVAAKNEDVKFKTQEIKSLETTIAEVSADREGSNTELSAVLEYYSKLQERCVAKPETYEERVQRRKAEVEGLKQALAVLEDETAFVQRRSRKHHGRRHLRAAALEADE